MRQCAISEGGKCHKRKKTTEINCLGIHFGSDLFDKSRRHVIAIWNKENGDDVHVITYAEKISISFREAAFFKRDKTAFFRFIVIGSVKNDTHPSDKMEIMRKSLVGYLVVIDGIEIWGENWFYVGNIKNISYIFFQNLGMLYKTQDSFRE